METLPATQRLRFTREVAALIGVDFEPIVRDEPAKTREWRPCTGAIRRSVRTDCGGPGRYSPHRSRKIIRSSQSMNPSPFRSSMQGGVLPYCT